jgi:hypothetical protein
VTRGHVTPTVTGAALGAVTAQEAIEKARADANDVPHAWHAFVLLATRHGWRSATCAAFVDELVKRAAAGREP